MQPRRRLRSGIKAVIFDMDGVITNTMPDHYKAWKTVLLEEGIPVTHHDIYSREGQRGITSVYEIFAHYGRIATPAIAHKLLKRKEKLFKRIVKTRFIAGARRFVKDLDQQNFKLALVTGTSRHELHRILPKQVFEHFDVVVTGSDVVKGKPDPEPYRKALKLLGISPRQAIVIENAPLGIRSAVGAGILCLALETSLPRNFLREAKIVFSNIEELRKHLKFLN